MIGGFATFLFIMSRDSQEIKKEHENLANEEMGILELEGDQMYKSFNTNTKMTVLNVTGPEANVITFDYNDISTIYNPENSAKVKKQLDRMSGKKSYTFEEPLFAYNPYGTNNCSMYIYYETSTDSCLKYTVTVPDETVPDFNRILVDSNGSGYKNHEYEITGLMPGMTNYLYLESCTADGDYIDSHIYQIDMPQSAYGTVSHIVTDLSGHTETLTNGLYFCFGTGNNCIPLYDNSGCLRGEIPLISNNDIPLIVGSASLILACSDNAVAKITQTGQVTSYVLAEDYRLASDMAYNGMGQVFAIASEVKGSTKKDLILSMDMEKGTVTPVVDMKEMLKKQHKKANKKDWIGLNSIESDDQGNVILCADKLSGIFKVSNILSANPALKYIIGDKEAANIKGLKNKCYAKTALEATAAPDKEDSSASDIKNILDGDKPVQEPFEDMVGNVSMHYIASPSTEEGNATSYYVYFMNNNNGNGTQYWKYLIDEETNTYLLRLRCTLPNNLQCGSVMESGSNIVAMSPSAGVFGEYKDDGTLIAGYALNASAVEKYSMKGFWFQ